jgi:hypothetical protein
MSHTDHLSHATLVGSQEFDDRYALVTEGEDGTCGLQHASSLGAYGNS